jgi:hypothetical protein
VAMLERFEIYDINNSNKKTIIIFTLDAGGPVFAFFENKTNLLGISFFPNPTKHTHTVPAVFSYERVKFSIFNKFNF